MHITRKIAKIDTTNKLTVAFDVSKDTLNYYSEIKGKVSSSNYKEMQSIEDIIGNRTKSITKALNMLVSFAQEHGFCGLHIVCEPTGNYSTALMRVSHRLGHSTAYVSGENVHKAKVIENHDGSKNDTKDARVIYMLSKIGKELVYRDLPPHYKALRELNRMYDAADDRRVQMKCELHHLLKRLFCDFPMSPDWIYTKSGRVLMAEYSFSPYRIVADSYHKFCARMRNHIPRIFISTLKKLYTYARYSSQHCYSAVEVEVLEQHIYSSWNEYWRAHHQRETLREQIASVYKDLLDTGEALPLADGKVFNEFHIGRILGETGPLPDFAHWRVLFKYGGLNLRTRQSGRYKGKVKLSKKGRIYLRLILGKMIFRFVRHSDIFGEYYHRRKEKDPTMAGTKIMANLERKLLRIVYGMAKRQESFNKARYGVCESQYSKAA